MFVSKRLNQLYDRQDAPWVHFELGVRAWEGGELYGVRRHRVAIGLLPEAGPGSPEYRGLRWRELWLQGDADGALREARAVAEEHPEDADGALDVADLLRERGDARGALEVLLKAVEQRPDDVELLYELGVAAEVAEEWELRREVWGRVWEAEHATEPAHRLWLSEGEFLRAARAGLARVPPGSREAIGNLAILVDDYPERWVLDEGPGDPRLLGLFVGPERSAQQSVDGVVHGPAQIFLFRWNIERVAGSAEEALEEVEITVLHELGHYLGLDEAALDYLGLG